MVFPIGVKIDTTEAEAAASSGAAAGNLELELCIIIPPVW